MSSEAIEIMRYTLDEVGKLILIKALKTKNSRMGRAKRNPPARYKLNTPEKASGWFIQLNYLYGLLLNVLNYLFYKTYIAI